MAENNKNKEYKVEQDIPKVDKEKFRFVQQDEKIFDKKFDTKPIGYFKDAMIRFAKNKTNVYATIILFFMIIMAIFVPELTTKRTTGTESHVRYMPPRMPIVENFGIARGYDSVPDQVVDRDTIGTIDGYPELGLPFADRFDHDFIDISTLENYTIGCTSGEQCYGGQGQFSSVEAGESVFQSGLMTFEFENDPSLEFIIADVSGNNTSVDVLVEYEGEFESLLTFDSEGEYSVNINDVIDGDYGTFASRINFEMSTEEEGDAFYLETVRFLENDTVEQEDDVLDVVGYRVFPNSEGDLNGAINRRNGELLYSSFDYDRYNSRYSSRHVSEMSGSRFDEILNRNPEACEVVSGTEGEGSWEYAEGCSIMRVNSLTEIDRGDIVTRIYDVEINYMVERGYDSVPYHFFGTDAQGRDLFGLSWMALRTSLLLGVVVSFINITFGVVFGSIEGYYGGKADLLMERFAEIIGRIPWLVTLSIMVALLGSGLGTLVVILIFQGWIGISGVTRTQFYRYKGREYVLASRTLGSKDSRLIFRHILPNAIGTIITASILSIPLVIFAESTISYLGFGLGHGTTFDVLGVEFSGVSIGVLLADGQTQIGSRPYLTVFPAIIISILMITFNMFGNALRDAFNPSLRGSE